jgi:hypothetical protein
MKEAIIKIAEKLDYFIEKIFSEYGEVLKRLSKE